MMFPQQCVKAQEPTAVDQDLDLLPFSSKFHPLDHPTFGSDQTGGFSGEQETTGISLPFSKAISDGECLDRTTAGFSRCYCFAGGPLLYDGIRLTMTSKVLNGSQRVVMDGVISDDECRELQRLTNVREPGDHTISLRAQPPPTRCLLGAERLPAPCCGQSTTSSWALSCLANSTCFWGLVGSSNFRRWLPGSDLPTHSQRKVLWRHCLQGPQGRVSTVF